MCRKLWKHPKSIRNLCLYLNNPMYKSIYIQFVYFLQIHTSQWTNFCFKGNQIASIAPSEKAKRIELFTNNGITRRQAKSVCKLHKLLVDLVPKTQNKTITRSRSCPRTTRSGTRGRVHTRKRERETQINYSTPQHTTRSFTYYFYYYYASTFSWMAEIESKTFTRHRLAEWSAFHRLFGWQKIYTADPPTPPVWQLMVAIGKRVGEPLPIKMHRCNASWQFIISSVINRAAAVLQFANKHTATTKTPKWLEMILSLSFRFYLYLFLSHTHTHVFTCQQRLHDAVMIVAIPTVAASGKRTVRGQFAI